MGASCMGQGGWITPGASDIIIPAACSFVCEIKRRDHTKSKWQPGQVEYLESAKRLVVLRVWRWDGRLFASCG
jgi:hypothetical protein